MCEDKKQTLSNDDLWDKAGSGQPITRDDLGISSDTRNNGTQVLKEGFDLSGFFLREEKKEE